MVDKIFFPTCVWRVGDGWRRVTKLWSRASPPLGLLGEFFAVQIAGSGQAVPVSPVDVRPVVTSGGPLATALAILLVALLKLEKKLRAFIQKFVEMEL